MSAASNTLRLILIGEDKSASKTVRGVGDETDKSSKKMASFHKVGKAAGIALAGGLALAGKAAFDMTKKAAEDQQAASRLAQTLQKTTGATKGQVAAVEDWITAQGKATGVTDDQLRPSLSKLVAATHDVGKAQKLASLAMDISAGTGKSLESVSFALAKAQNGNVSGLARLGVQTTKTGHDTMALEKAQTAVKSATLSYSAAVKAHGKHSAEAGIALDKLHQAEENVGAAREKTKKTTLSLDGITKKLADTYGGAAAKNADTAAGKQKILTTQYGELQEQIGAQLLPVMTKLMTIGLKVVGWISRNTNILGPLVAILGGLAFAVWAATAATAAWNAVLALNPISLVVIAIVALVAIFVVAYKKVGWFRAGVDAAFHGIMAVVGFLRDHWKAALILMTGGLGVAVVLIVNNFDKVKAGVRALGAVAKWLWNNAFAPALKFIVGGIAALLNVWGHMLTALGHVPGFGWAKDAGKALEDAAQKAQHMADAIGRIPDHKSSTVVLNVVHNVVRTTGGRVPTDPGQPGGGSGGGAMGRAHGGSGGGMSAGGNAKSGDIHVHVSGLVPADEQQVIRKIHSGLSKLKAQGFGNQPLGLA